MKSIYMREIRHMVANVTLKNRATGYRINSKSISRKIIDNLIKWNWVTCESIDDEFMYIRPMKSLINAYSDGSLNDHFQNIAV